jgi:hypothetical protein
MTKLLLAGLVLTLSAPLLADSDHNNGNGNDDCVHSGNCGGTQGPKGDKGADGLNGTSGLNGARGSTGEAGNNGKDGLNGSNASINNNLFLNIGAGVRWYDWKYVSLHSGYRYDILHYNHTVDAMVIELKLGKSYETRQQEKLEARIKLLERILTLKAM